MKKVPYSIHTCQDALDVLGDHAETILLACVETGIDPDDIIYLAKNRREHPAANEARLWHLMLVAAVPILIVGGYFIFHEWFDTLWNLARYLWTTI